MLTIALATIKLYGGIDMKKDVREMLNDFMNGLGELGETNGENVNIV